MTPRREEHVAIGAASKSRIPAARRRPLLRLVASAVAVTSIAATVGCSDGSSSGGTAETTVVDGTVGRPGSVAEGTKGSGRGASGEEGTPVPDGRPVATPPVAPGSAPDRSWTSDAVLHWSAGADGSLIVGSGDAVAVTEVAAYGDDGTERWRTEEPMLSNGPALVVEEVALIERSAPTGEEDAPAASPTGIVALEVDTGDVRWEDDTGVVDLIDPDLGVVVSRLPDRIGGRALDASTGEELWSTTAEPLAICGELVLTSTLVDRAVAVDARTGEGVELHDRPWTRATCLPDGGYVVQAVDADGVDIERIGGDGETMWSHPIESGRPVSGLTFTGGAVVVEEADRIIGIDAATGEELWAEDDQVLYRPVVVSTDRIFDAGIDGGSIVLLDAMTGRNLAEDQVVLSSAPVDGGYLTLTEGKLALVDAGNGSERWAVEVDAYLVRAVDGAVILDDVGPSFSTWRG